MSTTFRLYDATTGLFTGVSLDTFSTDAGDIAAFIAKNTPTGHAAYVGHVVDVQSQKIDVRTGAIVDHQPPQPSTDHEWNPTQKRWELSAAARARRAARLAALAQIAELERRQQRPLREQALGVPGARERLAALDIQIAALRAAL